MTWHIWGAIRGALVRLRCPHCKEVQARGGGPQDKVYICRSCKKSFTRAQGEPPPRS